MRAIHVLVSIAREIASLARVLCVYSLRNFRDSRIRWNGRFFRSNWSEDKVIKFLRKDLGLLILGLGIILVTGCASLNSTPDGAIGETKKPENFQVVVKGILWRGARPGTPNEYQWLIEKGVKTIVNLEFLHDDLGPLEKALRQHSLRAEKKTILNYARIREREWDVVFHKQKTENDIVRFVKLAKDESMWPK